MREAEIPIHDGKRSLGEEKERARARERERGEGGLIIGLSKEAGSGPKAERETVREGSDHRGTG